ncbi:DUF4327 family protein [Geminocystis sp. CENA526]|uniref:DUF4327 family protein n=1 Tax=Geminocystis sp. CENA526 TaxID=1355871 RepID=UPI003D6FC9AF
MTLQLNYSINVLKDEVRHLIKQGLLDRQQPIYTICNFIPAKEWQKVELELEFNGYLLRDHLIDLIQPEKWENN